ncbi:MAG: hypothetical protein U1E50_00095 [Caulobacteraceae bacterium]
MAYTERETRVTPEGPPSVTEIRREEVRENRAAWWVAGLVAVVAILAVVYLVSNSNTAPTQDQITAAAEQGRAQGLIEGSTAATNNAVNSINTASASAQREAAIAADRARAASDSAADAASRAADNASSAAASAADSASDAVDDTTTAVKP